MCCCELPPPTGDRPEFRQCVRCLDETKEADRGNITSRDASNIRDNFGTCSAGGDGAKCENDDNDATTSIWMSMLSAAVELGGTRGSRTAMCFRFAFNSISMESNGLTI